MPNKRAPTKEDVENGWYPSYNCVGCQKSQPKCDAENPCMYIFECWGSDKPNNSYNGLAAMKKEHGGDLRGVW